MYQSGHELRLGSDWQFWTAARRVAVIVSLGFVVKSIDQNTKAIEAAEANNIWEVWREVAVLPALHYKAKAPD